MGNLRGLLVTSLPGAEHLAFELEALEILGLLLGGALELELVRASMAWSCIDWRRSGAP